MTLNKKTVLYSYNNFQSKIEKDNFYDKYINNYGNKRGNIITNNYNGNKEIIIELNSKNQFGTIKTLLPEINKSYINISKDIISYKYSLNNFGKKRIIYQDSETGNIGIIYHTYNSDKDNYNHRVIVNNEETKRISYIDDFYPIKYDIIENINNDFLGSRILVVDNYILIYTKDGKGYLYRTTYNEVFTLIGLFEIDKDLFITSFELQEDLKNKKDIQILPNSMYRQMDESLIILNINSNKKIVPKFLFRVDNKLLFKENDEIEDIVLEETTKSHYKFSTFIYKLEEKIYLPIIAKDKNSIIFFNKKDKGFEVNLLNIDISKDLYNRRINYVSDNYMVLEVIENNKKNYLEVFYRQNINSDYIHVYTSLNKNSDIEKASSEFFYIDENTGLYICFFLQNIKDKEFTYNIVSLGNENNDSTPIGRDLADDLLYLGNKTFYDKNRELLMIIQNTGCVYKYIIKNSYSDDNYLYYENKSGEIKKIKKNLTKYNK